MSVRVVRNQLLNTLYQRPALAQRVKGLLHRLGYDTRSWSRVVPYQTCAQWLADLGPENLDVLEVSAGQYWRAALPFRSYTEMNFPEHDICRETLDRQFDLIIADQVFEHLPYPGRAARNVRAMLRPGGRFLILTPFLVRYHPVPIDCTRWTETGLYYLLEEAGFEADSIRTGSWGNAACVRANFKKFPRRGFMGSLKNDTDLPVSVWALARIPQQDAAGSSVG